MMNGMWRYLVMLFAVVAGAVEWPPEEFAARRARLMQTLPDSVVVLFGTVDDGEEHLRSGFFPEANFYYVSGWREPGAVVVLCSSCGEGEREMLFLPPRNARREIFDGPRVAAGDAGASAKTGFARVYAIAELEKRLAMAMAQATQVYTLFDGRQGMVEKLAPLRTVKDVRASITALRLKKSERELKALEEAIEATIPAHLAAWRATRPGVAEYEVAAVMQQTYFARGCERNAYAPIVGSGPNSVVLHYNANRRKMEAGEVLLMDVGAECGMYAADITRTVPVSGKWTERQKEVYRLVQGAQAAVMAAAKPGVMLKELTVVAREWLNRQGKGPDGKPWGEALLHGVSHHIGLDVHDPFDPTVPLEEGNVITVEPGVYLPGEKLGIRIEDMILITKDGARVLTGALPKGLEEIEGRMRR